MGAKAQTLFRTYRDYYARPRYLRSARGRAGNHDLLPSARPSRARNDTQPDDARIDLALHPLPGVRPSALWAGVVATFVFVAPIFNRQLAPLHFMTTMLAA